MRWRTHCTVSSRSCGSLTFGTFHAADNRGLYQKAPVSKPAYPIDGRESRIRIYNHRLADCLDVLNAVCDFLIRWSERRLDQQKGRADSTPAVFQRKLLVRPNCCSRASPCTDSREPRALRVCSHQTPVQTGPSPVATPEAFDVEELSRMQQCVVRTSRARPDHARRHCACRNRT